MRHGYSAMTALAVVCAAGIGANATTRKDARIASSVYRSFVFRHYLNDDDIKVVSKDGVVTLTGSVSAGYHKTLASAAADAQSGVKSVDDRLQIKGAGPEAGSDAWLAGKVKTALLFHRSVDAGETKVEATDGVVTLSGRAGNQAQKDLTGEYARDVDGVKDVHNELTVAQAPSKARRLEENIDDASITSEVKVILLFHRSTSALNTHVRTTGGVVTLDGKAASTAEKDLAGKIPGDAKGVKRVKNDIRVE